MPPRFTSTGAPLRLLEGGRQLALFAGDGLGRAPPEKYVPLYPHTWYVCKSGCEGCQFCNGGLGWCTVCDAFEGELLAECPGRKLSHDAREACYKGNMVDFATAKVYMAAGLVLRNGRWGRKAG